MPGPALILDLHIILLLARYSIAQHVFSLQNLYGGIELGHYFTKIYVGPTNQEIFVKISSEDRLNIACTSIKCGFYDSMCQEAYSEGVLSPSEAGWQTKDIICAFSEKEVNGADISQCSAADIPTSNSPMSDYYIGNFLTVVLEKPFVNSTSLLAEKRSLRISNPICRVQKDYKGPTAFGRLGLAKGSTTLFSQNNMSNVFMCLKENGGFLGVASEEFDRQAIFSLNRFLPLVEGARFGVFTHELLLLYGEGVSNILYKVPLDRGGVKSFIDLEALHTYLPLDIHRNFMQAFHAACLQINKEKYGCGSIKIKDKKGLCYQMDRSLFKDKIYFQRTFPVLFFKFSGESEAESKFKSFRLLPENYLLSQEDEDRFCLAFLPHNESFITLGFHLLLRKTLFMQDGTIWYLDTLNCGEKDLQTLLENKRPSAKNESSVNLLGLIISFSVIGILLLIIVVLNVAKNSIIKKERESKYKINEKEEKQRKNRKEKLENLFKNSKENKNYSQLDANPKADLEKSAKKSPQSGEPTAIHAEKVVISKHVKQKNTAEINLEESHRAEKSEESEEEEKGFEVSEASTKFAKFTYEITEEENNRPLNSKTSFLDS